MKYDEYVAYVRKIHDEYVMDVRYYSEKNFKELNPEAQAELAVQLSGRFLKCCTDSAMSLYSVLLESRLIKRFTLCKFLLYRVKSKR